jgi:hypothetical protein
MLALALDQQAAVNVACIEKLFRWQQLFGSQVGLNEDWRIKIAPRFSRCCQGSK